jgi:hypothetical protein
MYLLVCGVHDIRHVPETSDLVYKVWDKALCRACPWYFLGNLGQMIVRGDKAPDDNQEEKKPESDHLEDVLE